MLLNSREINKRPEAAPGRPGMEPGRLGVRVAARHDKPEVPFECLNFTYLFDKNIKIKINLKPRRRCWQTTFEVFIFIFLFSSLFLKMPTVTFSLIN